MGLARTLSVSVVGIAGHLVEVEVDLSAGLPGLTFTGLPDASVQQARDRVRAAVHNAGLSWPGQRITVALLPADVRKVGSAFDLAIAVAVLAHPRSFQQLRWQQRCGWANLAWTADCVRSAVCFLLSSRRAMLAPKS